MAGDFGGIDDTNVAGAHGGGDTRLFELLQHGIVELAVAVGFPFQDAVLNRLLSFAAHPRGLGAVCRRESFSRREASSYSLRMRVRIADRSASKASCGVASSASAASAMRASNVRVVDPAKIPGHPYKPEAGQSAGVGLLTGIFLGAAFIIMRERADRTIQQPGDTPFYLNLPELGIIPSGKSPGLRNPLGALPPAGSASDQVELVTWHRKPSAVAESFRSTLISIHFANDIENKPKILV